jgi:hypothetical protein
MTNKRPQRKRRRMPALDRYVIFALTALIIFTITAIVYQFVAQQELSSTLITCFFAAFGGELLMLCMIKRLKLKKGDTDEMAD